MYSDKVTKSVADAVKTVTEQVKPEMLNEELKGNQHKIDANKNNKIDAHDFKLLRAKKKVEEDVEQIDEISVHKMLKYSDAAQKDRAKLNAKWSAGTATHREKEKVIGHEEGEARAANKIKQKTGKYPEQLNALQKARYAITREDVELDEAKYEPAEPDADAIAKKKAREEAQRRREEKAERDADDLSKDYKPKTQSSGVKKVAGKAYGGAAQKSDVDESVQIDETPVTKAKAPYRPGSIDPATGKTREAPKGTMAYDAAQRKKLKESFSSLIESYVDGGIKSLFENLQVVEEQASEEEFNAELKKQKDKAEGKAPQADVAAAATQGTKSMKEDVHNEIQVVDLTDPDNIHTETIDLEERTLTAGETTEKERIVKGMKKGIEGFKQRYGEQGVAEGAKWRNHPDAHDINDDGDIYPKTRDMFAYDPLTRRQSTAGDARTARGKKSALKTSLKMAQGRHGPKSQLPEQQGVAEKD